MKEFEVGDFLIDALAFDARPHLLLKNHQISNYLFLTYTRSYVLG